MQIIFLLLIILFYPIVSFADIDECKTDIYFANGIDTERFEAYNNSEYVLKPAIIDTTYKNNLNDYNREIGKVSYAYNQTNGKLSDLTESLLQKIGWDGLTDLFSKDHGSDLRKQIETYERSLNAGNNVLTVAHSQGNLFTYEAFNAIKNKNICNSSRLKAISIASPMWADIESNVDGC